jgi:5-bromo-4-chloroindolyl phosphate hydrolysis protein
MTLPDGPRQIIAALLAGVVFLALYFGASLVWFAALPLAAVAYGALLLIIRRRPLLSEVVLSDRVTAADIAAGQAALDEALRRLAKAEAASDPDLKDDLAGLGVELRSIRTQIGDDPADFRIARRFIVNFLPKLVENVESYVSLSAVATGSARERLGPLREGIRAYRPAVTRIAQAGLENNFRALEAEIDALGFQLKRG